MMYKLLHVDLPFPRNHVFYIGQRVIEMGHHIKVPDIVILQVIMEKAYQKKS